MKDQVARNRIDELTKNQYEDLLGVEQKLRARLRATEDVLDLLLRHLKLTIEVEDAIPRRTYLKEQVTS